MAQANNDFQIRCQIIEEVKERPFLYNKGHPKYQINSVRAEEFAHIGVAVGKTGEYMWTFNKIHVDLDLNYFIVVLKHHIHISRQRS